MSRRNLENGRESSRSTEVSAIPRQVDLRVHDDVALDEIELYAEVLSAVAASDGPLSPTEAGQPDATSLGAIAHQTLLW